MQPLEMNGIPASAGIGLKPEYFEHILKSLPDIAFFEVHAENYMGMGGPPHRYLSRIRELYPLSLHGVGLSIGGPEPLDHEHLQRLRLLNDRYRPNLFSEHLAWSTHGSTFLNDLLPAPYNSDSLAHICRHIDQVQAILGRQMLLENPSTYLWWKNGTWEETDFIAEIVRRTGCGLLLDVNNVHVSCTNQLWDAERYIERFPMAAVKEFHLAGHTKDADDCGRPLLIDTHDQPISDAVWALFKKVIASAGPRPTLIEWDADLPEWSTLHTEAGFANFLMGAPRHGEVANDVVYSITG
jgi:uncharacterized protein (UPF0276 family)